MSKRQPNRYDSFDFPPYQYREFPKWVQPPAGPDGKLPPRVIVEDRDEERLVTKTPTLKAKIIGESVEINPETGELVETPQEDAVEEPDNTSEDLEYLRRRATDLGVAFSKQWGVTKLQRAIKDAQEAGNA